MFHTGGKAACPSLAELDAGSAILRQDQAAYIGTLEGERLEAEALLKTSDEVKRQPKPVSPYNRNPYEMLARIRDRVTREPVGPEWPSKLSGGG
jgi:hypothetical protein